MSKQSTSFYLSEQAHENIENITKITGANKTAVVEIAIGILVQILTGSENIQIIIDKSSAARKPAAENPPPTARHSMS